MTTILAFMKCLGRMLATPLEPPYPACYVTLPADSWCIYLNAQ